MPINSLIQKYDYLKSPLNYTGGKYKLLSQIIPLFPSSFDTFIDLFTGGCNVAININANNIVANDINPKIIELYNYFKNRKLEKIENEIESIIKKYNLSNSSFYGYEYYNTNSKLGLSNYNKEKYLRLREEYNKNPNPIMFYTLIIYAFNNQIRFNKKGEFNLPVNKRDFTQNMRKNLKLFVQRIQKKNISFVAKDFNDIDIPNNSFVYVDPPYLATIASYNENRGWTEEHEYKLLKYLDKLDNRGIKFALSNVLENKGVKNNILLKWCQSDKYRVHCIDNSYSNCSYQTKNRDKDSTEEVLITNYKPSINVLTSL